MRNYVKYTIPIFILLFIQSGVFALPNWVEGTNISYGLSIYSPTEEYWFNVTWSSDYEPAVIDANFSSDFSGSWKNYTANIEGNISFYKINLPAGNFGWKFYANDLDNNMGVTEQWNVVIYERNTSLNLWIDGEEGNKTVDTDWTINLTTITDENVNVTIEMNCSDWNWSITNTTVSYNLIPLTCNEGLCSITAYVIGNGNYTSNNVTYNLTINKKSPSLISNITDPQSLAVYSLGENYTFNLTVSDGALNSTIFTFNGAEYDLTNNYDQVDDNTRTYYKTISDLPGGIYNYSWFVNDSSSLNYSSGNLSFTVKPKVVLFIDTSLVVDYNEDTLLPSLVECTSNYSFTNDDFSFASSPSLGIPTETLNGWKYHILLQPDIIYRFTCSMNSELSQNYTGYYVDVDVDDVTPTSTTTTTTSSGGSVVTGTYYIQNLDSLTVKAGESGSETFIIKNNYSSTMRNLNLSLVGIPYNKGWCSLDKTKISRIDEGATASVKITCNIPDDAEARAYTLTVRTQLYQTVKQQTMTLTVASAAPLEEEEVVEEEVVTATVELNETANVTTPTGFILAPELIPDIILVAAFIACLLILVFRDKITETLFDLHRGYKIDSITEKVEKKPKPKPRKSLRDIYNKYSFKLNLELKKPEKEEKESKLK